VHPSHKGETVANDTDVSIGVYTEDLAYAALSMVEELCWHFEAPSHLCISQKAMDVDRQAFFGSLAAITPITIKDQQADHARAR
jgi:hypothetical protein